MLRFRKFCCLEVKSRPRDEKKQPFQVKKVDKRIKSHDYCADSAVLLQDQMITNKQKRPTKTWRCIDSCCWSIGCLCSTWWLLLFLFQCLPANLTGLKAVQTPGARLKHEGLTALHPVILVPGIVTGGLELWEGKPCSEGLFRRRLWGGGSFAEIFKRPNCWLEHLSLDNETGLDPPGIRVRPVSGLAAADYFAPGYFVWAILIENLARMGYEDKNMYMASYDWRLASRTQRDRTLTRLKSKIELMYVMNGYKKVVVVPHSMGVIYFLHFIKWVEAAPPMGGGAGPGWCAKHIKAVMNIGPAFLGVPKAVGNILSAESKDVAFIRAMAPGLLDSDFLGLQTLEHIMRVSRTWDSIISLLPKGGDSIWGNLDWSPEEAHVCDPAKRTQDDLSGSNGTAGMRVFKVQEVTNYGRIVSFGRTASELHSSGFPTVESQNWGSFHSTTPTLLDASCGKVWTEYEEMSQESIWRTTANKTYSVQTLFDLLRFIAPKMMKRAEAHFSHGIADDLNDPKYNHYKYWSNPLETMLPDAPDMEIYCLYGVGIPTERSYVYKHSPSGRCRSSIPLQIDSSADGSQNGCLRGGVYFADGDESVPVLSAGYMCAKGWRGQTRFNPSNISTFVREYKHKAPASLLEGRGLESGAHVDIMGNVALIEDILRVAAGASGIDLGGDRIYSDILNMAEKIKIQL